MRFARSLLVAATVTAFALLGAAPSQAASTGSAGFASTNTWTWGG